MYCEEMAGIHRLPALLFEEPDATLESLHLHQYDVLSCEPLHTIKGHITNLFEELPRQVPKKLKNDFRGPSRHLLMERMPNVVQITEKAC